MPRKHKVETIRATPGQRAAYAPETWCYPLWGWALLPDGTRLAIEDLRPDRHLRYEVIAPEGHHFGGGHDCHSLLCIDLEDLRDRLTGIEVVPCTPGCGCGCEIDECG